MSYSEEETETLALAAYQKKPLRCPRCGARVTSHELGILGRRTTPLRLRCERCGAHGQYSPDHLEEMNLEWTREEKIRIVERYWGSGVARCPRDGAVLTAIKSRTIQPPPPEVRFICPHCGRSFSSSQVEKEKDPETFEGRYEEINQLDQGGMGTILIVRQRSTGDVWAAKRIRPEYQRNPNFVRRFRRESRILEQLQHPHVVPVKETYLDDAGSVIVMQYVGGGTLKEAINDPGVSLSRLVRYFIGVVNGLIYLHEAGIIHRDLKPDNVLIDTENENRSRISDFGLAKLVDRDSTPLTRQGQFLGTRNYAAPEQQDGSRDVNEKCDIYALSLIAFEIATRQSPYRNPINVSGLPELLQEALVAGLAEDPEQRPATGRDLEEGLLALAKERGEEGA